MFQLLTTFAVEMFNRLDYCMVVLRFRSDVDRENDNQV